MHINSFYNCNYLLLCYFRDLFICPPDIARIRHIIPICPAFSGHQLIFVISLFTPYLIAFIKLYSFCSPRNPEQSAVRRNWQSGEPGSPPWARRAPSPGRPSALRILERNGRFKRAFEAHSLERFKQAFEAHSLERIRRDRTIFPSLFALLFPCLCRSFPCAPWWRAESESESWKQESLCS